MQKALPLYISGNAIKVLPTLISVSAFYTPGGRYICFAGNEPGSHKLHGRSANQLRLFLPVKLSNGRFMQHQFCGQGYFFLFHTMPLSEYCYL